MSSANRLQVLLVRETVPGTTPITPRMRTVRLTGESLDFTPEYVDSDELRSDRMLGDPIKVMQASTGGINFEVSYPTDNSPLSELYRSALFNAWVNSPQADNDGDDDSAITDVATTGEIVTGTFTGIVRVGHLARFTGFGVAGNNGVFRATVASATVPAFVGAGLTNEVVPPAAARIKVVGFAGAASDINATSTGLSSTALVFTNMGLVVGQWVKIGGTGAGNRFVLPALNAWVRVTAITATTLTFDNLPTGWTTETGTGLTIKVWFADQIRNGTTATSLSIEKGFLDQTTPTYIVNTGMQVNTFDHAITSRQKITGSAAFMGMGGGQSTVALDASPDIATTGAIFAANSNVGRVAEAGAVLTDPNWSREIRFQVNNNLRTAEDVTQSSPVQINAGECTVTGQVSTYFGSNVLLAKLYDGTATAINTRVQKNNQAIIYQFPRVTMRSGNPNATGKNTDTMLASDFTASLDSVLTLCSILIDRVEYYET